MTRAALSIALFAAALAYANVAHAIPTIELPPGKPSTITVSMGASSDGQLLNWDIVLDAADYDPVTNQVVYLQSAPSQVTFENGDGLTIKDLTSVLDPSGSFNASYTDVGAPSSFTTVFNFPAFAPTMFGNVLFSGSVSGSITDGTPVKDGVSYTPNNINGVFKYELLDTTAATIATFFHDPGATFPTGPPNSHTTGSYDNSGAPLLVNANPNGVGTVVVTASFTGSGGIDQYGFTGRWDVVPEPSSIALAAMGGLALLWQIVRRRRRS